MGARQIGTTVWFSDPIPLINFSHIAVGYVEQLRRKYSLPGFVEVSSGDVVVDCGAFVGGFSLSAATCASEVHIFEPAPENMKAVARNFADFNNASLNPVGLDNFDGELNFQLSDSAVEHSFMTPDDGVVTSTLKVPVSRLDTYFAKHQNRPNFTKIEAAGVEIEVFEGLGELRPEKIAFDVSPERDQESPADYLTARLEELGYLTQRRYNVLFADIQ